MSTTRVRANEGPRGPPPTSSKSVEKKRAVSMLTPMAPNTIAKLSAWWSVVSLPATSPA